MHTRLTELQRAAGQELRHWHNADQEARSRLLRTVAELFVDARQLHTTAGGGPDWRGRTYDYRTFVGRVFEEANLPEGARTTVQGSLRYHIGNVLRERLSAGELESLGLRVEGPRERSVEKRAAHRDSSRLFTGGTPLEDADDIVSALEAVSRTVSRIHVGAFSEFSRIERRAIDAAAEELLSAVAAIRNGARAT